MPENYSFCTQLDDIEKAVTSYRKQQLNNFQTPTQQQQQQPFTRNYNQRNFNKYQNTHNNYNNYNNRHRQNKPHYYQQIQSQQQQQQQQPFIQQLQQIQNSTNILNNVMDSPQFVKHQQPNISLSNISPITSNFQYQVSSPAPLQSQPPQMISSFSGGSISSSSSGNSLFSSDLSTNKSNSPTRNDLLFNKPIDLNLLDLNLSTQISNSGLGSSNIHSNLFNKNIWGNDMSVWG